MPQFRLRIWAEQVLFDCNDYVVDAPDLTSAVKLLQKIHEEAGNKDQPVARAEITSAETWGYDDVRYLEPEEVITSDEGVTLIDENGERVRDLVSVPTGCTQLGEPLIGYKR